MGDAGEKVACWGENGQLVVAIVSDNEVTCRVNGKARGSREEAGRDESEELVLLQIQLEHSVEVEVCHVQGVT